MSGWVEWVWEGGGGGGGVEECRLSHAARRLAGARVRTEGYWEEEDEVLVAVVVLAVVVGG